MSEARAIAADFQRAHGEVCQLVRQCSEADWTATCPAEGWPVGGVVAHIVDGYGTAVAWAQDYLVGRPVALTREENDALNASRAAAGAALSRTEALDLLESRAALVVNVISNLRDEQLAITHPFGLAGGQELNLGQLCGILVRHTGRHLISCRAAVSAG
jgi:hypothetical protein